MWYPTLSDVIDIYERIATYQGHDATISDSAALDRIIVAPQRHGTDRATAESLSRKAAAMYVTAVQNQVFESATARTAYVLVSEFLDRNGAQFEASVAEMMELSSSVAEGAEGDKIASWIEERVTVRPAHRHRRRLLGALTHLARTIEELERVPGLEQNVRTLGKVGGTVAREVASLFPFQHDARSVLQQSFPAVDDRWGDEFGRPSGGSTSTQ